MDNIVSAVPWVATLLALLLAVLNIRRPSTITEAEALNAMYRQRVKSDMDDLVSARHERALLVAHNGVLTDALRKANIEVPSFHEWSEMISKGGVRDVLHNAFDVAEMRSMAFDMGITQNSIGGATGNELADSIWSYCQRNGRLTELAQRIRTLRPNGYSQKT